MAEKPKVVFYVGGPDFHPTYQQAEQAIAWLGDGYEYDVKDGLDAFEALDQCHLLVLLGLHWTGSQGADGEPNHAPMAPRHQESFEQYVRSGKPLLAHHGAIASYDDWPRYGELIGVRWVWEHSTHSPLDRHTVRVLPTGHPVVAGLEDYTLYDELYYNLHIDPAMPSMVHAEAFWEEKPRPMLITAEGGRVDGAGKMVYMANGHDMRAYESPAIRTIWHNAVAWLMTR
jgi:uncharacterized protein